MAQANMSAIAGSEVEMIDLRKNYDLEEINDFFTRIKKEGRQIHRYATGVTDMLFPFFYGILFILINAFLLKNITNHKSSWIYLSLIPILLMLVDFRENFNTLKLLDAFPNMTEVQVHSASTVTGIKSLLTSLSLTLTLVLGIIWLIKWGLKYTTKRQ